MPVRAVIVHSYAETFLSPRILFHLIAILLSSIGIGKAAQPPNVVLIITDDQGYGDIGFHGNSMIQTPNLDALARQSVRFTNFHVDPTCAETRSALMTGRYSCRVGVWHTVMGRSILRRGESTMAEAFAANGYRTAMFGKWHLGDNWPYRPHDRGFQLTLIHGGGGVGQTPDSWGNDYFDDTYLRNGKAQPQQGYCTDVWFREAMKFIDANRAQPFFCYLATNAPHGPYNVDPKYSQPYVERGVPQPMANFYGMITNIDENISRLLARLDEWNLRDNTIVIFMTDNGSAAGTIRGRDSKKAGWQGFDAGMREMKGSQYEGGHRVPCFVRWPKGGWPSDRQIDRLAAHFDLLPTLAELCQLRVPSQVSLDGRSLVPLLREEPSWPERTLVVHSQRVDHPEKWRKCAVMSQNWRLIDGRLLYDMTNDAAQQHDVAAGHAEVVSQLRNFYESWWTDVSKRFDEYSAIPLGSPAANLTLLNCMDWHAPLAKIPWSQSNIAGTPDGEANGFWAVEVTQDGRYEFTLRMRPPGVPYKMPGGQARLRVGDVEASAPIAADGDSVKIVLDLKAGATKLQSWLNETGHGERGAFFVEAKRLP